MANRSGCGGAEANGETPAYEILCRTWEFSIDGRRIRIPKLGWVPKAENQGAVGVDLGVSALATRSTGEQIIGPKAHAALLARLKRLSRALSRKQQGSANHRKAKVKLAKLHARITNTRQDALHKLTTDLTRRFHTIGIEDLNVRGMMSNRHLARSIADMSFRELRRQLEYKAAMRGGIVVVADCWYPGSKTCSTCGSVQQNMAVSSTVSACGEEGAGLGRMLKVKPASMKQEVGTEPAEKCLDRFG